MRRRTEPTISSAGKADVGGSKTQSQFVFECISRARFVTHKNQHQVCVDTRRQLIKSPTYLYVSGNSVARSTFNRMLRQRRGEKNWKLVRYCVLEGLVVGRLSNIWARLWNRPLCVGPFTLPHLHCPNFIALLVLPQLHCPICIAPLALHF